MATSVLWQKHYVGADRRLLITLDWPDFGKTSVGRGGNRAGASVTWDTEALLLIDGDDSSDNEHRRVATQYHSDAHLNKLGWVLTVTARRQPGDERFLRAPDIFPIVAILGCFFPTPGRWAARALRGEEGQRPPQTQPPDRTLRTSASASDSDSSSFSAT